jgi:hypothetical protein
LTAVPGRLTSKRFEILYRKLDGKSASASAPAIALEAAGKPFAITVDLDELLFAAVTQHHRLFLITRAF